MLAYFTFLFLFSISNALTLTTNDTATNDTDENAHNTSTTGAFDRFFVIILENADREDVMRDMYMGSVLPSKGQLLTEYYALMHPSQGNYLAMISGQRFPVVDYDVNIDPSYRTIVDLFETAGKNWKAYMQSLPTSPSCFTGTSSSDSLYRRKHNPFISFSSISEKAARCKNIVPATQLDVDIATNEIPDYVFYTPDMKNDGHDTTLRYASNWLKGFLDPMLENPKFSSTLFLVTFDETESHFISNNIYAVLLGKGVSAGRVDSTRYSHFSQIATMTKAWGLGKLSSLSDSATAFRLN